MLYNNLQGRIQGGKRQVKKIWFFGIKSRFFTRNTPKIFAPPSALRNFFMCTFPPPNWKSWICPWSAEDNFNKYSCSNTIILLKTWTSTKVKICRWKDFFVTSQGVQELKFILHWVLKKNIFGMACFYF